MQAQDVTVPSAFPLQGTLTLPHSGGEKFPAVLFLHGSGPIDRNSDAKGLPINAFKQFAEQFARIGFASLRYDKRGVGKSGGSFVETGMYDLIDDAVAAVKFLKQQPQIDPERIYLLGHSEGAILAPQVLEREPVTGLILLSGVAESLKATVDRQNEMVITELDKLTGFKGFLIRLLGVANKVRKDSVKTYHKLTSSTTDTIRIKGIKVNAKWFREHYAYDVSTSLANVTCPTLVITGSKDIQVLPAHAEAIAALVQGPAEWHVIQGLTHMLRKTDVEPTMLGLKKDYAQAVRQPIDQELVSLVNNWLQAQHA
ncbi:hypothetical protein EV586_11121 [Tumebacillus sp. BK434]|uniref:alpha/beta hydrolase family protein n=1 Tax=Tumebacillus sp. BK434 TaxID=2512169 RepID=UPI0010468625|nr:alpha/beta fold hydrolase [Tumebacillus sp. BK434]TCP52345.1 hypothetical protein EV586_11121 [Tumebacillus sp. BK434]